jgi:glycosyltransferase involved in cell wall biosynthesis
VLYVEHNMDGTIGGSHHCLLDICRNIDRSRYSPMVLFFQENPLVGEFRKLGIKVLIGSPASPLVQLSGLSGPVARITRAVIQPAYNAALVLVVRPMQWIRFLHRQRIELVHLNNTFNGDHDLILAAWLRRIPCIAHQRGYAGETGALAHWFGRRLHRIIAISGFIRDDLLRRGLPDHLVTLIHDGIDPERITVQRDPRELRTALGFGRNQPVIGMVGNLKPWKGQHVFMEAFARIAAKHPEARGLIVGAPADPEYVQQLRDLAARHCLSARVVFAGYQQHSIDYMASMDVVIHASVEPEPFGIVIGEAMALSKPVIASAHGGPLDIVQDGVTGFLTAPGDPGALALRIGGLLDSPADASRLGERARRRFLDLFTIEANVGRIIQLYDEILFRS